MAYASRILRGSERLYGITEKELLAIVWAVDYFHVYCLGAKVRVVTDHAACTFLRKLQSSRVDYKHKFARWVMYLQVFDLELVYRPGKTHQNADGLSRMPLTDEGD